MSHTPLLNDIGLALAAIRESQGETIELATQYVVQTLLAEGKIYTCGNGVAASAADFLAVSLMHRNDQERPGLPAISLSQNAMLFSAITRDNHFGDTLSRQIRTLAQRTDILIAFSVDGRCPNIIQAIQAMHDKEGRVIAFVCQTENDIAPILNSEDLEVPLPNVRRAIAGPCMISVATELAHGIETLLFGSH